MGWTTSSVSLVAQVAKALLDVGEVGGAPGNVNFRVFRRRGSSNSFMRASLRFLEKAVEE